MRHTTPSFHPWPPICFLSTHVYNSSKSSQASVKSLLLHLCWSSQHFSTRLALRVICLRTWPNRKPDRTFPVPSIFERRSRRSVRICRVHAFQQKIGTSLTCNFLTLQVDMPALNFFLLHTRCFSQSLTQNLSKELLPGLATRLMEEIPNNHLGCIKPCK